MVDQGKIILGGFAAAGVVFLSFILLKKFGPSKKDEEKKKKDDKAEKDELAGGDIITSKVNALVESEPSKEVSDAANDLQPELLNSKTEDTDSQKILDNSKTSETDDTDSKTDKVQEFVSEIAEDTTSTSSLMPDTANDSLPEVSSSKTSQPEDIGTNKLPDSSKVSDDADSDKVQEVHAEIIEETACTSSFMMVNSLENLPDDNIKELLPPANGKKADHSSDESSYDVIEDETVAADVSEDEDNKNKDLEDESSFGESTPAAENKTDNDVSTKEEADKPNTSIEDSLNDTNEASIVIVEESGSSFYASAEESVSDNKEEKKSNENMIAGSKELLESGEPESEDTVTGSIADQSAVVQEDQKLGNEDVSFKKENVGEKTNEDAVKEETVEKESSKEDVAAGAEEENDEEIGSVKESLRDEPEESIASDNFDPVLQDQKENESNGEDTVEVEASSLSNSMSSWLEVNETEKKGATENNGTHEISDNSEAQLPDENEPEKKISITEAVLSSNLSSTEANKAIESPSSEEMTTALSNCQSSPSTTTLRDIDVLAAILSREDKSLQLAALDCLVRVTAFSQHNTALRDSGIPQLVAKMTVECCSNWQPGDPDVSARLEQVCQVVTNLTLDPATQAQMEATVPALVGLLCTLCSVGAGDRDWLAGWLLRPLTNFSSTQTYTIYFPRLAAPLLGLLESGPPALQLSVLRVLVNLSLEPDLLPHFMAARAPENLLKLLELPTGADVTLRVLTFLANLEERLLACPLAPLALPVGEGLATLQVALRGEDAAPQLRSRVFKLTRHADQDVVFQASRLYKAVTAPQPK